MVCIRTLRREGVQSAAGSAAFSLYARFRHPCNEKIHVVMKCITAGRLFLGENYLRRFEHVGTDRGLKRERSLFVCTRKSLDHNLCRDDVTLAMASVWDRTVYLQALQDFVTTDPL